MMMMMEDADVLFTSLAFRVVPYTSLKTLTTVMAMMVI